MRKIVLAVLVLMSIASLCHAELKMPTNQRWLLLDGEHDIMDIWVDKNTLAYENCKYLGIEHIRHKGVRYWLKALDYKNNEERFAHFETDLECSIETIIEGVTYDDNRNVLQKQTVPLNQLIKIYPDSRGEYLMNQLNKIGPYNKNKKDAKKTLESWLKDTEDYKAEKNKK